MIGNLAIHLSTTQCDFLIEHIDCVRPIRHGKNEDATRNAMLSRGLINYEYAFELRPKGTILTRDGKHAVCTILAHYIEQLMKTGIIKKEYDCLQRNDPLGFAIKQLVSHDGL